MLVLESVIWWRLHAIQILLLHYILFLFNLAADLSRAEVLGGRFAEDRFGKAPELSSSPIKDQFDYGGLKHIFLPRYQQNYKQPSEVKCVCFHHSSIIFFQSEGFLVVHNFIRSSSNTLLLFLSMYLMDFSI